jgi:hypothetical protein
MKVKKAFIGGIFKKNSTATPSNGDVKDSSLMGLLSGVLKGFGKNQKLPDQYYNMNFTSLPGQSTNIPKVEGLDINVMDSGKVKTMKVGGSVEIGKGKDYIKDLL